MVNEILNAYENGTPYFGVELLAEQGSAHFAGFPYIVGEVRKTTQRQRLRILEIGSWAGHSIVAWDRAAQSDCDLVCIDPWKPYFDGDSPNENIMNNACKTGQIKELFLHNTRVCGLTARLTVMEGSSEEQLKKLQGELFDIVFIDGDHFYKSVVRDIKLSMPLVRMGGVLCGDDMEKQFPEVINKDACREENKKGVKDHIQDANGIGYHIGVTQGVYDVLGNVYCLNRLWFKRRLAGTW